MAHLFGNARYVAGKPGSCPVAKSRARLAAEIRSVRPSRAFRFTPARVYGPMDRQLSVKFDRAERAAGRA